MAAQFAGVIYSLDGTYPNLKGYLLEFGYPENNIGVQLLEEVAYKSGIACLYRNQEDLEPNLLEFISLNKKRLKTLAAWNTEIPAKFWSSTHEYINDDDLFSGDFKYDQNTTCWNYILPHFNMGIIGTTSIMHALEVIFADRETSPYWI